MFYKIFGSFILFTYFYTFNKKFIHKKSQTPEYIDLWDNFSDSDDSFDSFDSDDDYINLK